VRNEQGSGRNAGVQGERNCQEALGHLGGAHERGGVRTTCNAPSDPKGGSERVTIFIGQQKLSDP